MIQIKYGDLLSVESGYIVHGCNAQGIMGSGIAKSIKEKYPSAYDLYIKHKKLFGLKVGSNIYAWQGLNNDGSLSPGQNYLCIVNAITQQYYGRDRNTCYVSYEGLRKCFQDINKRIFMWPAPLVVNFPLIGCGLANGDWNIVSKIIDEELDDSIEKVLWVKN